MLRLALAWTSVDGVQHHAWRAAFGYSRLVWPWQTSHQHFAPEILACYRQADAVVGAWREALGPECPRRPRSVGFAQEALAPDRFTGEGDTQRRVSSMPRSCACPASGLLPTLIVCLLLAGSAGAREWRFTEIAREGAPGVGAVVGTVELLHYPSLNEAGDVAFVARLRRPLPSPEEVDEVGIAFVTAGDEVVAVSDPAVQSAHGAADVGGAGHVAWRASDRTTYSGAIWRWADGSAEKLADEAVFDELDGIVRINDSGRVSFSSTGAVRHGVYTADGTETVPDDYQVIFEDTSTTPAPLSVWTGINDAGQVVFARADVVDVEGQPTHSRSVFVGDGTSTTLVAGYGSTLGDRPGLLQSPGLFSMNAAGHVAFGTILQDFSFVGIFLFDGSEIRTLVGATEESETVPAGSLALNDLGELAYVLNDATTYDFASLRVEGDVVLRRGDTIDGEAVQDVEFLPDAFNNAGQLALQVELANGYAIYRADPIPEVPGPAPAWEALLAVLLAGTGAAVLWRLRTMRRLSLRP